MAPGSREMRGCGPPAKSPWLRNEGQATAAIPHAKLSRLKAADARPGLFFATPKLEAAIASAIPRPLQKTPAKPSFHEPRTKISSPKHRISMAAVQTRVKPHRGNACVEIRLPSVDPIY